MNQPLAEIAQQIKAREFVAARTALMTYLKAHPNDAYAWYLLSFAEADAAKRLVAAQRALKLQPDNEKLIGRVSQLRVVPGQKRQTRARLVILAGILGLVLVAAAVILLRPPSPTETLPTLVALGEQLDVSSSPSLTLPAEPSATLIEPTQTLLPTDALPSPEISPTGEAIAVLSTTITATEVGLLTTDVQPTSIAVATLVPTTAVPLQPILPTVQSTSVLPLPPTVTSTATLVTPPATVPPTVTLEPGVFVPGIPLNNVASIGTGQMMVVSATRPGNNLIGELGGSAPNPSAGSAWVVIELLLICTGNDNCAPDTSAFKVIASTGTNYPFDTSFTVPTLFNARAYSGGQVWGYLGFSVPNSETSLSLVVTQNGQSVAFALQ